MFGGVCWWRANSPPLPPPLPPPSSPSRFFKQRAGQDLKRLIFKYDFISLQRRHLLWQVDVSPEEETYPPPLPLPLISSSLIISCHLDSLSSTSSHPSSSPVPPLSSFFLFSSLFSSPHFSPLLSCILWYLLWFTVWLTDVLEVCVCVCVWDVF